MTDNPLGGNRDGTALPRQESTPAETIDDYILRHIDAEGEYLHALWRDTQLRLSYGQMASGHLQGRLLKMIAQMVRPKRVLELGTFSGYATLCLAEGMPEGSEIHTIEVFDENEDFLRRWFEGSAYKDKIHLHIGDALKLLPQMESGWDLAYIDADKRQYVDYYEQLLPRMSPGGFIVADNTLWYGHVLHASRPSDLQTRGVQAFNELVAGDSRVEKVILPLRDGLTLIRVKPHAPREG